MASTHLGTVTVKLEPDEVDQAFKELTRLRRALGLIADWPGSTYPELALDEIVGFAKRVLEGQEVPNDTSTK